MHRHFERYCVTKRSHIQLNSSDRDTVWGFWCHLLLWSPKPLNFYRRIWPFLWYIFHHVDTLVIGGHILDFHSTFITKYDVFPKGRMKLPIWLTPLNPVMNRLAAKHWLLCCNSTEQFVISQNTHHLVYWGRPTRFPWFQKVKCSFLRIFLWVSNQYSYTSGTI